MCSRVGGLGTFHEKVENLMKLSLDSLVGCGIEVPGGRNGDGLT